MMTIKQIESQLDFGFKRPIAVDKKDASYVICRLKCIINVNEVEDLERRISIPSPHFIDEVERVYNIFAWLVKHNKLAL